MSSLNYQRDGYARAVFDGKVETNDGDFSPQEAPIEAVVSALNSTSARVRMRAVIALASRGNVRASDIISVALMKHDKGEYDFMAGKTYGPSRFCPTVSRCVELFLPVIVQASPSGVMEMITSITRLQDIQAKQVMDILTEGGAAAVAAALAVSENVTIDSLIQAKTFLTGKVPDIPQLLTLYIENPARSHPAITQFLASKSPEGLHQFLTGIFESGEKATPWLLAGIQHQTNKNLCRKLAEKCGPASVSWLINGLSSTEKRTRLACAYALSCTAGNSQEARSALHKASEQETGWLSRWQMRRYSRSIGK